MKLDIDWRSGKIIYDDFNLDLDKPFEGQIFNLQEDLLQVKYEHGYVLDLGWYPELNPEGTFLIHVIKNSNWDLPFYQKKADAQSLIGELQKTIDLIISLKEKAHA